MSPAAGSGTDGTSVEDGALVQAVESLELGETTWVRVLRIDQSEQGTPLVTPLGWVTAADLGEAAQAIFSQDLESEGQLFSVTNVAVDDTLNVREAPGVAEEIRSELFGGQIIVHSGEIATIPTGDVWTRVLESTTSATLGWINTEFITNVTDLAVLPVITNSDGSPFIAAPHPTFDHGADSDQPTLVGLACNAAQIRISSTVAADSNTASFVRIGSQEPRGVVTPDAPLFVDWQLGDDAIDVSVAPGGAVLMTVPTDGATWHFLDLGSELESDVLVGAGAQPIRNDDGTFIAAKRKRFTAPNSSC